MAQQRRIVQNKISKREQERIEARRAASSTNFATIAMRIFIVLLLIAMVMGLAINIIIF